MDSTVEGQPLHDIVQSNKDEQYKEWYKMHISTIVGDIWGSLSTNLTSESFPPGAQASFQEIIEENLQYDNGRARTAEELFKAALVLRTHVDYPGLNETMKRHFSVNDYETKYKTAINDIIKKFTIDGVFREDVFIRWAALQGLKLSSPGTSAGDIEGFVNTIYLMNEARLLNPSSVAEINQTIFAISSVWAQRNGEPNSGGLTSASATEHNLQSRLRVNEVAQRMIDFGSRKFGIGKGSPFLASSDPQPPSSLGDRDSVQRFIERNYPPELRKAA
jgi:hypothetical protein